MAKQYEDEEIEQSYYASQGMRDPSPEELAEFGIESAPAAPVLRDPTPEELAEFGLETPANIPTASVPIGAGDAKTQKQKADPLGLKSTRTALEAEYHAIAAMPETDSRRKRMETEFMDRWTEQQRQEQIADLSSRVTLWGAPAGDTLLHDQNSWVSGLRNAHEWMVRLGGKMQSGIQTAVGDQQGANETVRAVNDLKALNRALDGDSALGKKYGPMFGEIAASLGESSLASVATGGLNGVAGVMAIGDFTEKMAEADSAGLAPEDQWKYAARGAAGTYGSMLLFGKIAQGMGVSAGDSVIPRLGKTGTDLLTKAGLGKMAISGSLEGAEEAAQTLMDATSAASSGVNPDATNNLFDQLLKSFTTGAFVGSVAEFGQNADALSPKALYLKNTLNNWVGRVAKKPKSDGTPEIADTVRSKDVEGADGTPIRRVDINNDLDALAELRSELESQYQKGGAREFQQSIDERGALLDNTAQELRTLDTEIGKWKAIFGDEGGEGPQSRIRNLIERRRILDGYNKELSAKQKQDKTGLKEWQTEFETLNKDQLKYVDDEMQRLVELDSTNPSPPRIESEKPASKPGEPSVVQPEVPIKQQPDAKVGKPPKSPTERARDAALGTRIRDLDRVRKALGLEQARDYVSTGVMARYEMAVDQGLDQKAEALADEALAGRVLTPNENAGIHLRTLELADLLDAKAKQMATANGAEFDGLNNSMNEIEKTLDHLTRARIRSNSETGSALQMAKAFLGKLYSPERALTAATRLKGADLSKADTDALRALANDVKAKQQAVEQAAPNTPEFDQADYELSVAMSAYKHGIEAFKPKSQFLSAVDQLNAVSGMVTLTSDLVAFGRQGAIDLARAPLRTVKNAGSFFKTFTAGKLNDIESVRKQAFLSARSIKEDPLYSNAAKSGYKLMEAHTAYSDMESSLASYLKDAFDKTPGLRRLKGMPFERFDLAMKSWLNTHRFNMIKSEYELNKDAIDRGELNLDAIVQMTNEATGHIEGELFGAASPLLVAPRWAMNRVLLPPKAVYWAAKGGLDTVRGKQSMDRYRGRQVAKVMAGGLVGTAMAEGIASIIYGAENVDFDRDPMSGTFGTLRIHGRRYDFAGGLRPAIKAMALASRGAYDIATGTERKESADASKTIGGLFASRLAFTPRTVAYAYQGGRPAYERDPMPVAEYMVRNFTPLNAQATVEGMIDEGMDGAIRNAAFETWGFGSFPASKK